MTEKQKDIFEKIRKLRDQLEDFRWEMNVLRDAYDVVCCERDAAIQRAEGFQKIYEDAITGHQAILQRLATSEADAGRLRTALSLYGNPENWRFSHDKDGNLLWVTSIGPDYATEILSEAVQESSEKKETANV